MCFLSFVIDVCLYLRKDRSEVDSYNCLNFAHGCPTGTYRGSTVYKSKVANQYFFYVFTYCKDQSFVVLRMNKLIRINQFFFFKIDVIVFI